MPDPSHLKICMPCAEISPLVETVGLADVTANLADYFSRSGHDCRVLTPLHGGIDNSALEIEAVAGLQDLETCLTPR